MAGVGPVGAGGGAPLYLGRTEMMATILREEKPVEKAGREYFRFTQDMTDALDMLDEAAIGQDNQTTPTGRWRMTRCRPIHGGR